MAAGMVLDATRTSRTDSEMYASLDDGVTSMHSLPAQGAAHTRRALAHV